MNKAKAIATWIVSVLLFALFTLMAGRAKLIGWPAGQDFHGYSGGFRVLIGAIEVVGGIALLIPPVASYAAVLLCGVMVGAAQTHWREGESLAVPVVTFLLLAAVGWARRPAILRGGASVPAADAPAD